jgi:hypothetical protein
MELLCHVSDGSPRNLEQLAARSLHLATARREPLVPVEAVRAALAQLKELPLQWNEPSNLDDYAGREACEHADDQESPGPRAGVSERDAWTAESSGEPGTSVPGWDVSEDREELTAAPRQEAWMQETSPEVVAVPSLPFGDGSGVIEFGAGITTPPVPVSFAAPTPVPAAHPWSEIDIDDRYALLDRQFETGVPANLPPSPRRAPSIPAPAPAPTAVAPRDDIEQRLLQEVEEVSRLIHRAAPSRSIDEPQPDSSHAPSPPSLATSPWCTGWSEMPEWDVVQPEWVVETPVAAEPARAVLAPEPPAAPPEVTAPITVAPQVIESAESDHTPITLSFATHQPAAAAIASVLPATPAAEPHHETIEPRLDAPLVDHAPERSPSVRIDQPAARPYSRLFSRLRRLRAG